MFVFGKMFFGNPVFGVMTLKVEAVGFLGDLTWQKVSEQISPQNKVKYNFLNLVLIIFGFVSFGKKALLFFLVVGLKRW
jgi:hypothetical protein